MPQQHDYPLKHLAAALFLSVCCALQPPALAQNPPAEEPALIEAIEPSVRGVAALPAAEQLQEKIAALEKNTGLTEADRNKALESYQRATLRLQDLASYRGAAERYKQALESAPAELSRLQQELQAAEPAAEPALPVVGDLKQLEARLGTEQAELSALQGKLAEVDKQLAAQRVRPEDIRKELAEVRARLTDIEQLLQTPSPPGEPAEVSEASKTALLIEQTALGEQRAMLEQELFSHATHLELLDARQELLQRQVRVGAARVERLQQAVNDQRRREAAIVIVQTERATQQAADKPAVVREAAEQNQALSKQLAELTIEIDKATQTKIRLEQRLEQLKERFQSARQQLEIAGLSDALGPLLRSERLRLPSARQYRLSAQERQERIEDVRLKQFQNYEQRRRITAVDEVVEQLLTVKVEADVTAEQRQGIATELRQLIQDRRQLLDQLNGAYASYVGQLTASDQAQRQLIEQARQYANLLDEKLLWIASGEPTGGQWLAQLRETGYTLLAPQPWLDSATMLRQRAATVLLLSALVVLAWLGLLAARRPMRKRLQRIGGLIGKVQSDGFLLTLQALMITVLLALPWPLLIGYSGWLLATPVDGSSMDRLFIGLDILDRTVVVQPELQFLRAVGVSLFVLAVMVLFLALLMQLCRRNGVADLHFHWGENVCRLIRVNLRWFLVFQSLPTFLVVMGDWLAEPVYSDTVGRLAFIVGSLVLALFLRRILHPTRGALADLLAENRDNLWWKLRYLWYLPAFLGPLLFVGLALLGYYYTALRLESLFFESLWLLVGVVLGVYLIVRWINVQKRRLALARARARREAIHAARSSRESASAGGQGIPDTLEYEEFDVETISVQMRDLLRMTANITVVVGLWLIWDELLPALTMLNDITLWQYTVKGPEGDLLQAITLRSVVVAVIVIALTGFVARNLPGVLEISVLQRFAMEAGNRYAITTISRYVITAVGLVIALQMLGIQWEKAQWLIAALSVGLGFGLQEIFANFVSGLIILLERPIRVGDTVTVSEFGGTVTRIRIRATTITDWDRKEIVIPNKTFITGALINWTLSDPITRVIIRVGIAYGSDTALAQKVILETVEASPLVLKDPPPAVLFLLFGDSSLNFEIRVFVKELADRMPLTHELHMSIDRALRAHGIEIPFPQRDLHLKSVPQGLGEKQD